jgi:hypothetical protein
LSLALAEEYFDHSTSHISDGGNNPLYWGYDFWNNTVTADPATYNGSYSTTVFADWAVETIQQHASQAEPKPMYMYLAFQAVHMPLMAPQAAIDKFNATIADPRRRTFAAMANEMDTAVGRVVGALKAADMLDNTIIVLTTDNVRMPHRARALLALAIVLLVVWTLQRVDRFRTCQHACVYVCLSEWGCRADRLAMRTAALTTATAPRTCPSAAASSPSQRVASAAWASSTPRSSHPASGGPPPSSLSR